MTGRALVVGATGISGGNVAARLLADGWDVTGLSRRSDGLDSRVNHVSADLEDVEAVAAAVRGTRPTYVFFTT
jgi:nucleoside-diphosphate-sugar epimerase